MLLLSCYQRKLTSVANDIGRFDQCIMQYWGDNDNQTDYIGRADSTEEVNFKVPDIYDYFVAESEQH